MNFKAYISVLLISIFLGKFLAVDANGLSLLFSDGEILLVNSFCKSKQAKSETEFSQVDLSASQLVILKVSCTSQYQLELFSWDSDFNELTPLLNKHFSSRLCYLYLDNASPPPQLA